MQINKNGTLSSKRVFNNSTDMILVRFISLDPLQRKKKFGLSQKNDHFTSKSTHDKLIYTINDANHILTVR